MSTRAKWIVAGTVAAVVLVGAAFWIWQVSSAPATAERTPEPASPAPSSVSVQAQAQAQLDEHLQACAESTASSPPESCGIRIPWGIEFSSVAEIRFHIDTLPALNDVSAESTVFLATGGVLVATVSGLGQDGAEKTETYRSTDWSVRGDLAVDDEEVTLTVW